VASRCAWVGPFGVIVSQNVTDPALGPAGLQLLRQGLGAGAVLNLLLAGTPGPDWRQIGVIDRYCCNAVHSGAHALAESAVARGHSCFAVGNLLASKQVPALMLDAYGKAAGKPLPERLLLGLEAGLDAGGETSEEHAAGLHVANCYDWPVVDLRVDWHEEPLIQLRHLWELYEPQQAAFESRAVTPGDAPVF
jgi:uncharacterized Ntn-hydrolase superfamily protein